MPEQLFSPRLSGYLDSLIPSRPAEMQAMEAYAKEVGFPIIGPAAGHLCYQITKMINAKQVFELGSGYGYSTAWFAKAVQENGGGKVFHVVWDEQLSKKAQTHLTNLGYQDIIEYRVSEAVKALEETDETFDLIFNDIDKESYPSAFDVIDTKLRSGGVLIVDNMLWSGRIFDSNDYSAATQGVKEFTDHITSDQGWISNLIPIRDGLMVAYKK
ncbi:MAG: O-methyltransferase [Chloroflexi bacterium]|nr:O-methyltransferase [Chloroflexota bacterium]